jgi:arginase
MRIAVVCVPYQMDVARWGYALGPQAFIEAGLLGELEAHGHQVSAPVWIELPRDERTRDSVTNLGRIAARTSAVVAEGLAAGADLALVLEGDCTHAAGAIGGLAQSAGEAGVVWFDAHGDLNTMETTTSGYIGGMAYAVALGWDFDDWRLAAELRQPVRAEAAALLGTSDLDPSEIAALARQPILHIPADNMMDAETGGRLQATLEQRAAQAQAWYLHFDMDVAGPVEVPGGMTPAPHWPPRERLLEAVGAAAEALRPRVIGLATYNPGGDETARGAQLGIAVALAAIDNLA